MREHGLLSCDSEWWEEEGKRGRTRREDALPLYAPRIATTGLTSGELQAKRSQARARCRLRNAFMYASRAMAGQTDGPIPGGRGRGRQDLGCRRRDSQFRPLLHGRRLQTRTAINKARAMATSLSSISRSELWWASLAPSSTRFHRNSCFHRLHPPGD